MLLIIALCAVLFAWLGVQRERKRIRLEAELDDKEFIRKYLQNGEVVSGMEAIHTQRLKELDADIAKRREALGLQPPK
jgi:hypothetical protein